MTELHSAAAGWATVHEFAADPGVADDDLPSGEIFHVTKAGDESGIHVELSRIDRLRFDADGRMTFTMELPIFEVLNGANDVASFEVLPTRGGIPVLSALTPAEQERVRELVTRLRAAYDDSL